MASNAEVFRQVIQIALETSDDPAVRALAQTLRDLGDAGTLTDDQLSGLTSQVEGLSGELSKLDSASGAIDALRTLSKETLAASRAFRESQKEAAGLATQLQQAYARRKVAAEAAASAEGAAAKEARKELRESEKQVRDLERSYKSAQDTTSSLSLALQKKTEAVRANRDALRQAGVDTNKLGSEQQRLRSESERAVTALRAQIDAVRGQADAARALKQRLAEGDEAFRKQTQANRASSEALAAYKAKVAEAAAGTKSLGGEVGSSTQRLGALEAGLGKLGALAASVATALGTIRFASDQFSGAVELQQRLAEVQAVSGATAATLGDLRDAAQDAAEDTGMATEAVTAGMGELARAGFDAEQVVAALKPTLDLAQAGALGLSEAVGIATTTLTQFGLNADDAQRVADVLAQAANASQTSVQGLGLSLSYAAPLARQLGLSLEETTAVIAALGDEGFRGERAGTALRNVFSQLLDPSSKFREALNQLGITGNNFGSILEQLAAKGEAGKAALLALDSEARPAIAALFGKGGASVARFTEELQRAEGAAAKTAGVIRDTLGNSFDRLSETVDNAFADLIDPVLKPLQAEIEGLAASIKAFAESPEFAELQTKLAGAFTDGLEAAKKYASEIDYDQLASDIGVFIQGLGDAARTIGELSQAVGVLNDIAEAGFGGIKNGALGLAQAVTFVADQFNGTAQQAREYAAAVDAAGGKQNSLRDALDTGRAAFDAIAGAVEKVTDTFGLFGRESDAQRESAARVAEALSTIGVEAKKAAVEVTEEGQKIISALNLLATESITTGEQFTQAFSKGLDSAKTLTEIDRMKAALEVAFSSGKIGAVEYGVAMAEVTAKTLQVKAAADEAAKATTGIGTAAEQAARVAIAAAEAMRSAYVNKADQLAQAMAAAIAKYGAESPQVSALGAQVADTEAKIAAQNKTIEKNKQVLAQAGEAGKKAGEQTAAGATQAAAASEKAGESAKAAGEEAEKSGSAVGYIIGLLQKFNDEFAAISENARQYFVEAQRATTGLAKSLHDVEAGIFRAADATRAAIAAQRAAIDGATGAYSEFAAGIGGATYQIERLGQQSEESLRNMAEQVRQGRSGFELLDQASLDKLGAEIDRAAERVRRLKEEAAQAKAELEGLANGLQDELDRRAGNDSAILERQYREQIERINGLAQVGGDAARRQAEEARRLAERNYLEQLAALREQQAATQEQARQTADTQIAEAQRAHETIRDMQRDTERQLGPVPAGQLPRVEVVVRNEQRPGGLLSELSEQELDALARRILQVIRGYGDFS